MKKSFFLLLATLMLVTVSCNKKQQEVVTEKEAATEMPVTKVEEMKAETTDDRYKKTGDMGEDLINQFSKNITLTDQQAQEIRDISNSVENAGLSADQLRQARRDVRGKIMQGILTPEQRAAIQAARDN